jgi:hypothetical protein
MQLALFITVPTLLIALGLTLIFERDICIVVLDWLRESEWKKLKLSPTALARLLSGRPKAVRSRPPVARVRPVR